MPLKKSDLCSSLWASCDELRARFPRVPLLFALDAKRGIPGGFRYVPDCGGGGCGGGCGGGGD